MARPALSTLHLLLFLIPLAVAVAVATPVAKASNWLALGAAVLAWYLTRLVAWGLLHDLARLLWRHGRWTFLQEAGAAFLLSNPQSGFRAQLEVERLKELRRNRHGAASATDSAWPTSGLTPGVRVRLAQDFVATDLVGDEPDTRHAKGEVWETSFTSTKDGVMWFRKPDGTRQAWDYVASPPSEWFEQLQDSRTPI